MKKRSGHLKIDSTKTQSGKLIDTWVFKGAFDHKDPVLNKTVQDNFTAKIYIHKESEKIWFSATGTQLPKGGLKNESIQALKESVEEIFCEQYEVLTNAVWMPWLQVNVSYRDPFDRRAQGALVGIEYKKVSRTIDASGRAWILNDQGIALPIGPAHSPCDAENFSICGRVLRIQDDATRAAYIEDTPENLAAIEDICARMRLLHQNLSDLLGQDSINKNLVALSKNLTLLPSNRE